jgi:hypothetical protein
MVQYEQQIRMSIVQKPLLNRTDAKFTVYITVYLVAFLQLGSAYYLTRIHHSPYLREN